jgi:hypothetical protein
MTGRFILVLDESKFTSLHPVPLLFYHQVFQVVFFLYNSHLFRTCYMTGRFILVLWNGEVGQVGVKE